MHVLDFESVIQQLKPFLPDYLQERGIDIHHKFHCLFPDHKDEHPSANLVGTDTDEPRVYCHSCSRSLDLFDAVQILENKPALGGEWVQDTLKYLADRYGIPVQTTDVTDEQIYEIDTYRAYRAAARLLSTYEPSENAAYWHEVKKRKWDQEVLQAASVGTVSSYDTFRETLKKQGFSAAFLDEIDISRKDIFNPDNMIFTWKDEKGRPIGFASRNLKFEEQQQTAKANNKKSTTPKYNNQRTTGLKCNIFQKGRRFYGIDEAIKASSPLYIFEGYADVITARHHGLYNCVAIGGTALHDDHIYLLKQLGIYDVVLCLDGDKAGQSKLAELLENKFAGNRDMRVRVVILPEKHDPDSFIREEGVAAFKMLAHWSAFEWRLNQYTEDTDEENICKQMIPFIVNESSPVAREQQCKALAKRTGVSYKAIVAELNILIDEKQHQKSRARQNVLDKMTYELKNNPSDAETIIQTAQTHLFELTKRHDSDTLSNEDFVRFMDMQKDKEEKNKIGDTGFKLGPELKVLEDALRGEWSDGTFICIGGKPNVGKSAFLSKIATCIAEYNEDVVVLYHTIDDTAEQLLPRFVSILEGSTKLAMNMVRQPKYWEDVVGLGYIKDKRDYGYSKLRKLALDGRLIVKDVTHGASLPFAESLITYYQDKYPDRRIVYILDNFHKLRDFQGKDERVRFKTMSEATKSIALRRKCCIISTVEYTKLPPGIKPNNNNIAESGQIEYDANAIMHLYSEMKDKSDSFTVCHEGLNWQGEKVFMPRVEFILEKNKITDITTSFFLDFYPAASDYKYIDQTQVLEDVKKMKEFRKNATHVEGFDQLSALVEDK